MSMFDNKTKPELERGNYIAYADEPNTIVDNAGGGGGGGGGAAFFMMHYDEAEERYVPEFTYNQIKDAFLAGQVPYVKAVSEGENYNNAELLFVAYLTASGSGGVFDSFSVSLIGGFDGSIAFSATDPDVIMV